MSLWQFHLEELYSILGYPTAPILKNYLEGGVSCLMIDRIKSTGKKKKTSLGGTYPTDQ